MALEGDARHLITDVWTSAGVIIGVAWRLPTDGSGWTRWWRILRGGLNILREGVHLMWKSSEGLMDRALEPELIAEIERTLEQFKHPYDPLRPSSRRAAPASAASWTCTCTCPPTGRSGARRAARFGGTGAHERGARLRATIQLLPSDVEAHFDDEKDLI